jgi:alkanesulfonate monooxygenase SsuD/methylene tetrahydromethanopterin reductase-like flavin-dependent oxidoreductase (luciferase family)
MKFHWFHLMPWPDLPDDFREKYRSVWVDVPSSLYDPARGNQVYNEYLDELEYADQVGFDGICVNEHHQNAYGMMPSPNIMAAALARRTRNAALIVLGNSIALYNPPIRVAEEFAMLDVISGGRLVAGFPVGTTMDTNLAYGQVPITLREKYFEAHDLILKSWQEPEPFTWNGKFTQLRYVNLWPRPLQKPHPPVWIPGGSSVETWEWSIEKDYLYSFLSYGGHKVAKTVLDGYWRRVDEMGAEPNPYRVGFLQLAVVADSDKQAEEEYSEAADYFYGRCLHVYPGFNDVPGYRSIRSLEAGLTNTTASPNSSVGRRMFEAGAGWKDYIDGGNIVAGSPESVTEQLRGAIKNLRTGHMMMLMQFGNMPKEKVMRSTRLFAEKVIPNLRDLWSEWEDRWWIKPLTPTKRAAPAAVAK